MRIRKISQIEPNMSKVIGINDTPNDKDVYSSNATKEMANGVVLYNDENGNNAEVTLSDSAENYEYLEVFYKSNDNIYSSLKVYQPNNKIISMDIYYPDGNSNLYFKIARAKITTNTITIQSATELRITNGESILNAYNFIYITRVVGYY